MTFSKEDLDEGRCLLRNLKRSDLWGVDVAHWFEINGSNLLDAAERTQEAEASLASHVADRNEYMGDLTVARRERNALKKAARALLETRHVVLIYDDKTNEFLRASQEFHDMSAKALDELL